MTEASPPAPKSFEAFLASLRRVQVRTPLVETPEHQNIRAAAERLRRIPVVDRASITSLLTGPGGGIAREMLRVLGLGVGLSHERLRTELNAHLSQAERRDPERVVSFLDDEFGLVDEVRAAQRRRYRWSDVLVARAGTRQAAGQAIAGGRSVEDAIETVARELGLPYQLRTRFRGRNASAPCDLAIPAGDDAAEIVCAAKGFDSTGSKLSDAVREIEEMANVRRPTQFVFAVVDGIGWHLRQADLARIFELLQRRSIDGLYSLAMLDDFRADIDAAATQRRINRQLNSN